MPGLLRRLRRHFNLGLVSSTSRKNVNLFLKATRSKRLFSVVLSGEDAVKAKPAPGLYRKALARLRLRPSEALVIEDAIAGIQSARRLGIPTLGLVGTSRKKELLKAGARKTFTNLRTLARYVEHL